MKAGIFDWIIAGVMLFTLLFLINGCDQGVRNWEKAYAHEKAGEGEVACKQ